MRVAYLTAGAGGMYCGSCMRDNTLAAALLRMKRDVVLIPVYTPIRTDEQDVSEQTIVFGGINVFLQQFSSLFRFMPRFVDRLLDHPGLLKLAMRRAGSTSAETAAPYLISILRAESGAQRREVEKLIERLRTLEPQIVHLPDALFVGLAGPIKRALKVPVVCTLTGEDIFLDKLPPAQRDVVHGLIRERGRDVDGFLSVSRYYANVAIDRFGIASGRIHHVPLGIRIESEETSRRQNVKTTGPDMRVAAGTTAVYRRDAGATDFGTASDTADDSRGQPFRIGYLARICHEKGLHVLCEALALLRSRGRDCRLVVAGYIGDADRSYFHRVKADLAAKGLADFVELLGEVDRSCKLSMLRSLDVFSVPTTYREAKGIYVLEALSQGIPVVQPAHGSFPELLESTGGGILVEPNSAAELADGISRLMDDPERRAAMGEAGRAAVQARHSDAMMADAAWRVFESVAAAGQFDADES